MTTDEEQTMATTSLDLTAAEAEESTVSEAVTRRMQEQGQLRDLALASILTLLGRTLFHAGSMLDGFAERAAANEADGHADEYYYLVGLLDEALDRIDSVIRTLNPGADAGVCAPEPA